MDKEASDESSTDLDELKNADWVRQQWNSDSASLLVVYFSLQSLTKALLPLPHETSPEIMASCVAANIRRMWTCWIESRGGQKDAERAEASLLWKQADRAGVVQPREEKAPGRP